VPNSGEPIEDELLAAHDEAKEKD